MARAPALGAMWRSVLVVLVLAGCSSEAATTGVAASALVVSAEQDLDIPSFGDAPGAQYGASVLATPDGYLVVWADERDGYGIATPMNGRAFFARVADDGTVLDPTGVPLTGPNPPYMQWAIFDGACATDGTCLVLAGDNASLFGWRIQNGTVLDPAPLVLATGGVQVGAMSVAWDGAQFRVSWQIPYDGIYTARVGLDGIVGPRLLVVPDTFADPAAAPSVACDDQLCLIAFLRNGGGEFGVYGMRVDPSGLVGTELVIFDPAGVQLHAQPVWDGARFWVVVSDMAVPGPGDVAVDAIRVEPDGTVLAPIQIAPAAGALPSLPNVAPTADGIVVTWIRYGSFTSAFDLFAARVDASGTVLDPGGVELAPAANVGSAPLACRGTQCLCAMYRQGYNQATIVGDRLAGVTELDPALIPISTTPAGQTDAAIAFGDGQYLAVWRDSRLASTDAKVEPIRGVLVPPGLAPPIPVELGPSLPGELSPATPQDSPAVAATGGGTYLVAWHAGPPQKALYGQIVDATGATPAPAFVLDDSPRDQTQVAVGSDGSAFLAVWTNEEASPPTTIYARRFAASGAPLDPARFLVSVNGFEPAIAFDGAGYLVVWAYDGTADGTSRDIHARRITPDGTLLDPADLVVANLTVRESGASVACGVGICLVAWRSGSQVRAARIASDGTVLEPGGTVIGSAAGTVHATATAFDGDAFVVAWRDGTVISGAVVGVDGAVAPPGEVLIADAPTAIDRPALAPDGAGHVVAVYDRFDPDPAYQVRRVRARLIGPPLPQPDAAVPDAAASDAPIVIDAPSPPDAPIVIDAPSPPDAPIVIDAPDRLDAEPVPDADGDGDRGGCGCRTGTGGSGGTAAWIVGVGVFLRRRRRVTRRTARA